jgi:hypothetical protein
MPAKKCWPSLFVNSKKKNLDGKFQNSKLFCHFYYTERLPQVIYRVSQKWRTNYLLPYPGRLNVHEKNMEKIFETKK